MYYLCLVCLAKLGYWAIPVTIPRLSSQSKQFIIGLGPTESLTPCDQKDLPALSFNSLLPVYPLRGLSFYLFRAVHTSLITSHQLAATWGRAELMSVRDGQQMDGGPRAPLGVRTKSPLVKKKNNSHPSDSVTLSNDTEGISAGWLLGDVHPPRKSTGSERAGI